MMLGVLGTYLEPRQSGEVEFRGENFCFYMKR
jgi:hypothetical protein